MVVQHNITAMNANRYYGINNSKLSKSLEKLSSGYAINRAGDNAAGLAVSEKMRSQIAGMTQGVKNAQDGISMVQTFEGALTETQSILQRMKTLADQSANGTYQDDVDRDAIQLEFDQLNDELNQIADTDYNGVVVLNGGKMADGTVAQNGKFDYTTGYTTEVIANKATDISKSKEHTIVDQSYYDKERADAVWTALGVDVDDYEKLNVTFMYDGERWVSQTVTDTKGNVIEGANAAKLEARSVDRSNATGTGGFEVIAGKYPETGKDIYATNAIFDELKTPVKEGDTVTIEFNNSKATTYAPENIGLDECFDTTNKVAFKSSDDAKITAGDMVGKVSVTLNSAVTDGAMNKELQDGLDLLNSAEFQIAYSDGAAGTLTISKGDTGANGALSISGMDVVYTPTGGTATTLATLSFKDIPGADVPAYDEATYDVSDTGTKVAGSYTSVTIDTDTLIAKLKTLTTTDVDEGTYHVKVEAGDTNIYNNAGTKIGSAVTLSDWGITPAGTYANNTEDWTFTVANATIHHDAVSGAAKTGATANITFGLNTAAYNYADMRALTVHAVATPEVATMKYQVAQEGVSVSNAYKQGSAPLTYTDNITLQTGARGKDAVNFTFKYTSGGIGNLKSNMDCSARENGLNTENLSLATAKDANYAIDQIDNAINKVSMVRGTFGAIQNRLEHKIDNMNVSIENLTDAESKIRDTDMSTEMMNFTKNQILAQAAQSMLAQANTLPQNVLSLLQ